MIKRILVPLDGSALSEGVLGLVKDLAKQLDARLYLVQVINPLPGVLAVDPGPAPMMMPDLTAADASALRAEAEEYLSALTESLRVEGIGASWEIYWGSPAPAIIEFASTSAIDLIAMSTHGRSGFSRFVFGSVAEQVVREAGKPVLLVKPVPDAAKTGKTAKS